MSASQGALLSVRGLRVYFETEKGRLQAVEGLDFDVHPGEFFGLVGESGSGKSVSAFAILGLVEAPGVVAAGSVEYRGRDLLELDEQAMLKIRGGRLSMIFQEPSASLNPVFSIGAQISEVLRLHRGLDRKTAQREMRQWLARVGIADPERRARAFPHELSGGQAQRAMIAMALCTGPDLLIADEPTTALDVTIQAQIIDLLRDLRSRAGSAVILISHDLGVIAELADRVGVMYAGRLVEQAPVETLFDHPRHPYTQGLIGSAPYPGMQELRVIPGNLPDPVAPPPGCQFAPRCSARKDYRLRICEQIEPQMIELQPGHQVRCWLYQDHPTSYAPLTSSGTLRSEGAR